MPLWRALGASFTWLPRNKGVPSSSSRMSRAGSFFNHILESGTVSHMDRLSSEHVSFKTAEKP